jgi:hypothetical protein
MDRAEQSGSFVVGLLAPVLLCWLAASQSSVDYDARTPPPWRRKNRTISSDASGPIGST